MGISARWMFVELLTLLRFWRIFGLHAGGLLKVKLCSQFEIRANDFCFDLKIIQWQRVPLKPFSLQCHHRLCTNCVRVPLQGSKTYDLECRLDQNFRTWDHDTVLQASARAPNTGLRMGPTRGLWLSSHAGVLIWSLLYDLWVLFARKQKVWLASC